PIKKNLHPISVIPLHLHGDLSLIASQPSSAERDIEDRKYPPRRHPDLTLLHDQERHLPNLHPKNKSLSLQKSKAFLLSKFSYRPEDSLCEGSLHWLQAKAIKR
ncbi:hypothetical protein Salat_2580200, partial [Sesamum alatum]